MDNHKILLDNLPSLKLTLFDNLSYKIIQERLAENGVVSFNKPDPDLIKLRETITDRLGEDFQSLVNSTDKIDDPESFAKAYCSYEGKSVAKQAVDNFDWFDVTSKYFMKAIDEIEEEGFPEHSSEIRRWIERYLNTKYSELKILAFDSANVQMAIEEINQLLDDNGIDRHPDLPFTGYSFKEIQAELICDYEQSKRTDYLEGDLYNLVIDSLYEKYHLGLSNQYPDSIQDIIKANVKRIAKETYTAGLSKLTDYISDPQILNDIPQAENGYPALDDYFDSLTSNNGIIWRFLEDFVNNIDISSLANEIRPILVNDLANRSYDDYVVSKKDALNAINTKYPGNKIFELNDDCLQDMRYDYGKHSK